MSVSEIFIDALRQEVIAYRIKRATPVSEYNSLNQGKTPWLEDMEALSIPGLCSRPSSLPKYVR